MVLSLSVRRSITSVATGVLLFGLSGCVPVCVTYTTGSPWHTSIIKEPETVYDNTTTPYQAVQEMTNTLTEMHKLIPKEYIDIPGGFTPVENYS